MLCHINPSKLLLSLEIYNWLICFLSSICWFSFRSKIISTKICKGTSNILLQEFSYLSAFCYDSFKMLTGIWLSFLFGCSLPFRVSRVTSHFGMNATSFNQLEWLCVLQLIHDDNFSPGERLSCWDEKNGVKFALQFCCHSNIGRKTEFALNRRICLWNPPGLFLKQEFQRLLPVL